MSTLETMPFLPDGDIDREFEALVAGSGLAGGTEVEPFGIETATTVTEAEVTPIVGYTYTGTNPLPSYATDPDYTDENDDENKE